VSEANPAGVSLEILGRLPDVTRLRPPGATAAV